jgi:hypothetical protein
MTESIYDSELMACAPEAYQHQLNVLGQIELLPISNNNPDWEMYIKNLDSWYHGKKFEAEFI